MKTFVVVVDAGGFTAAANQMSTSPGVVSRSIAELEAHLHTRLLQRTTRKLALTEAGARYLNRCRDILASITEAEVEALAAHTTPVGTLKVCALASIGQHFIVPVLAAFQARYPELTIDLVLSHDVPDMLEAGHDVAILAAPDTLPDSSFVCQRLGVIDSVLCAAPRYLKTHGAPCTVDELSQHMCLQLTQPCFPTDRWRLSGPEGECDYLLPAGRFKVNLPEAMAVALHEGVGIGPMPSHVVCNALRSGALIKVLPGYRLHRLNVYAVYVSRKYLDAKIKSWIDFAREWAANATRSDDVVAPEGHTAGVTDGAPPVAQRSPRAGRRARDAQGSAAVAA
jgi:DNA-binding transcriptional LysR family regulator